MNKRFLTRLPAPAVLVALVIALFASGQALAAPGDAVADRVFGQAGSFTSGTCNVTSTTSLCNAFGVAIDNANRLYVADASNNRVLEYDSPLTSQIATRVFGQAGNFTTGGCAVTAADSLCNVQGVATDSAGRLYVADVANGRVLEYDTPLTSQIADRVFGQGGSFIVGIPNNGGISASSIAGPHGMAVDSAGRLYIADSGNNRVLEYDSPLTSQTATRVFGQAGDFTTGTVNNGGISAGSLHNPLSVAVDSADRLYIADSGNKRVLEYDSPLTSQIATRVFGQAGDFTTSGCAVTADSLCNPQAVDVDSADRLYVADTGNHRVLEYDNPLGSQTATRVFGQGSSFLSNSVNNGGLSASSLAAPVGVAVDSAGNLYVSDGNHRALEYDVPVVPLSVGGLVQQPDVATLPSPAVSGRSYKGYILAAAAGALLVAVAGAAGWRKWRGC